MNQVLIVSLLSLVVAQLVKSPIYYYKTGTWNFKILFTTGSMPSSHTALVVALCSSIGYIEGMDSSLYVISFVFALITIYDAIKVRGESGKQAALLNSLTKEVELIYETLNLNNNAMHREKKLKELIGHSVSEVLMGIATGLITVFIFFHII